jgi:hypothetical protein
VSRPRYPREEGRGRLIFIVVLVHGWLRNELESVRAEQNSHQVMIHSSVASTMWVTQEIDRVSRRQDVFLCRKWPSISLRIRYGVAICFDCQMPFSTFAKRIAVTTLRVKRSHGNRRLCGIHHQRTYHTIHWLSTTRTRRLPTL